MSSVLHEDPYLESWRWMSRQIRCGLDPDEPRLIEHYLNEGRYLACCTATHPWTIAETSFRLLIDTRQRYRPSMALALHVPGPGLAPLARPGETFSLRLPPQALAELCLAVGDLPIAAVYFSFRLGARIFR